MTHPATPKIDIHDIADRLWETADELRANSHLKEILIHRLMDAYTTGEASKKPSDRAGHAPPLNDCAHFSRHRSQRWFA